jgi:hypothetical protein
MTRALWSHGCNHQTEGSYPFRYRELTRPEWLMDKDKKTGRPSDPAQIILLTLAVNYVSRTPRVTCWDGQWH